MEPDKKAAPTFEIGAHTRAATFGSGHYFKVYSGSIVVWQKILNHYIVSERPVEVTLVRYESAQNGNSRNQTRQK